MKRIFLALAVASSLSAMAALPPLGNSLRELRALIQDAEFYKTVSSAEIIENITKTDYGYFVTTTHKQIEVHILYSEVKGRLGPAPFTLTYEVISE